MRSCLVCENVNESFMQLVENCSSTGCNMLASHDLTSSWWEEPTIDRIGPNSVPTLSVLGNPYIRGLCEPVRRLARAYLVCFRQYLNCKILHGMDFKRFFRPKTDDLRKKRSSPKSEGFFLAKSKI